MGNNQFCQCSQLDLLKVTVLIEDSAPFGSNLTGKQGLSFWVEAHNGDNVYKLLVDVGRSAEALMHNINVLGLDLSKLNAIMLTHCHGDHTGGLTEIIKNVGKKRLPVVAHSNICRVQFKIKPFLTSFGLAWEDSPDCFQAVGGIPIFTRDPVSFMPGLLTTGEIHRITTFEKPGTERYTIVDGCLDHDEMLDDIALIANVKGHGLVVITGCSHSGIINIVQQAQSLTNQSIYAVIGGFHLIEASDDIINLTVKTLQAYKPNLVAAGHCTGFDAQVALKNAFHEKFIPLKSGLILSFGDNVSKETESL